MTNHFFISIFSVLGIPQTRLLSSRFERSRFKGKYCFKVVEIYSFFLLCNQMVNMKMERFCKHLINWYFHKPTQLINSSLWFQNVFISSGFFLSVRLIPFAQLDRCRMNCFDLRVHKHYHSENHRNLCI